jgi:hypothetical protein
MRQTHPRWESATEGMLVVIPGVLFVSLVVLLVVMAALAFGT